MSVHKIVSQPRYSRLSGNPFHRHRPHAHPQEIFSGTGRYFTAALYRVYSGDGVFQSLSLGLKGAFKPLKKRGVYGGQLWRVEGA